MDDLLEDTEAPPEQTAPVSAADAHPAGLRRLLVIIGVLMLAAAVPYIAPGLEGFQAWQPGTELPFTGLFEFRAPVQRPAIAGGGQIESTTNQTDDDLLAAAPLPEAASTAEAPARPPAAADAAAGPTEAVAPRVPPERLAGLTRELEETGNDELAFFFEQLAAVGRGDDDAMARMMVYSVSTNGADRVTSTVRQQLQELFGDGGKGFLPIAPGWSYQGHRDVEWDVHNWRTAVVNRGRGRLGRYGLGGVISSNMGSGSRVSFGTMDEGPSNRQLSRWQIFYLAWPDGGEMTLLVDGEEHERVSLAAAEPEDRVHEVRLPPGPHSVGIGVGDGRLRLYGVTLENDGPGVVVDGLMLIGASVRAPHRFEPDHIATQVRQREPDLIVFWLGGNDVISAGFTEDDFTTDYGTTIERVRAGRPEASCLVVSVLDKGNMINGRIRTRPYVRRVVAAQQDVARAQGCAFYNLFEATGGEGTMARWFRSAPRLSVSDYTHLTEAGARVVGSLLARALLKGYDDFLAAGGRRSARRPEDGER